MVGNFIFVFISIVFFNGILGYTPLFYLDDYCGRTINVRSHGQIRLKLTGSSVYQNNLECTVRVEATAGYQLMVFYNSIDVENNSDCGYDWIGLHDGQSTASPYITGVKRCGNIPPSGVYITSGRYMTAYFHSDNSVQKSGFDMIITSYHTGPCTSDQYQCNNTRCIPRALTCNGQNPCGDFSDCNSSLTTTQPTSAPSVDKTIGPSVQQSVPPRGGCSDCEMQTKYMDDWCGNIIQVEDNQMRLQLTASPAYAKNMSCQVTLKVNATSRMMFYFKDMDIEQSGTCEYDYLEMDNGITRSYPYIGGGKRCGQTTPTGVFTTTGRYLTLYFHSDGSDQFRGFDMVITTFHTGICHSSEYQCNNYRCIPESLKCNGQNPCGDFSDCPAPIITPSYSPPCDSSSDCGVQTEYMNSHCGGSIYVAKNQQLRLKLTNSSSYQNNLTCEVAIETQRGSQMMMFFQSMDIETQDECTYDWLELDDGFTRANAYVAGTSKLCGDTSPYGIYHTSGRYLTVYFHSDSSVVESGFEIILSSYHTGFCGLEEHRCNNGKCISKELRCNGLNPCGDYSDCPGTSTPSYVPIRYLDRSCGTTFNIAPYDQLHLKLTNSDSYQAGMVCGMTLQVNSGDYMFVTIKTLNTENDCQNDWLGLYNGRSRLDSSIAGGKQCGTSPPTGVYKTSGRSLYVYFQSDSSVEGTGFDLLIQPSGTKYMDTLCGSTINIGDTNQMRLKLTNSYNYPPNFSCQVTIETDLLNMMMFYFRDLSTEDNCEYDWLEIDDGRSRSDSYLAGGKQCGHITPGGVYKSSGRFITLYFHSDGSQQDTGFDMIITSFYNGFCRTWESEYNCDNGHCISTNLTCNGYNSCGDYSDCNTRPCRYDEHQCNNGRCIPIDLTCNGLNPCGDYSDCTTTTSTTPRIYTDSWFTFHDYSLSVGAIVGISVSAFVVLVIIIIVISACSARRTTTRSHGRLQPQVATTIHSSDFAAYAYTNPVAVNYAEPPPSYTSIIASSTPNQGTASVAGVHYPNKK